MKMSGSIVPYVRQFRLFVTKDAQQLSEFVDETLEDAVEIKDKNVGVSQVIVDPNTLDLMVSTTRSREECVKIMGNFIHVLKILNEDWLKERDFTWTEWGPNRGYEDMAVATREELGIEEEEVKHSRLFRLHVPKSKVPELFDSIKSIYHRMERKRGIKLWWISCKTCVEVYIQSHNVDDIYSTFEDLKTWLYNIHGDALTKQFGLYYSFLDEEGNEVKGRIEGEPQTAISISEKRDRCEHPSYDPAGLGAHNGSTVELFKCKSCGEHRFVKIRAL